MKRIGDDDLNPPDFTIDKYKKKKTKRGMLFGPENMRETDSSEEKGLFADEDPFIKNDPIAPSKNKKYNNPDNDDYKPPDMEDFK